MEPILAIVIGALIVVIIIVFFGLLLLVGRPGRYSLAEFIAWLMWWH